MYDGEEGNGIEDAAKYPAQPPPPVPPSFAKTEIYRDPTEFAEVDRRAINVAQEDQKTFTDLVRGKLFEKYYRECHHRFRFTTQDDYFRVDFDHF